MKVYPICSNPYLNKCNAPVCTRVINFEGKTVNGNYYTDREYVDAMDNKNRIIVDETVFCDRYGFWEYVFTDHAYMHAKRVSKCIDDIKAEERRAQEAREARQRAFEREQEQINAQINSINQQNQNREQVINSYVEIKEDDKLAKCNLSDENLEILKTEVLEPIALSKLNNELDENVPNGVLIAGENLQQNEKVIIGLAEKILKEDFPAAFKKVEYTNHDRFKNMLDMIKTEASATYKDASKLSIIYIPQFDEIAKYPGTEGYSPELNSYLKVYFLDCNQNGCIILASAKDKDNIEPPFLINNNRFKSVIDV